MMIATPPNIPPSARLELREAAAALQVDKSTIQRWTYEGRLRCGVKKSNKRKYWLGADLIKFWKSEF